MYGMVATITVVAILGVFVVPFLVARQVFPDGPATATGTGDSGASTSPVVLAETPPDVSSEPAWVLALCRTSIIAGIFGFTATIWLPVLPTGVLRHVELPASPFPLTLVTADGHRFVTHVMLGRVQRYGRDGAFELGFPIDTQGGSVDVGLDRNGNLAVCAARRRVLRLYTPAGSPLGDGGPCRTGEIGQSGYLAPDGIIAPHRSGSAPRQSVVALLLLPLWHPVIAWMMIAIPAVVLFVRNPRRYAWYRCFAPIPASSPLTR